MAELVVADAPYTTYPGGVIALKCDEWMAGARGSLSSASDALACTGTRVRDTQTVSTSIHDDVFTAYTEADDTLEIPFSGLPLEFGLAYRVYLSYRVPGEWDVTNTDTLVDSTQARFAGVVAAGFHGIDGSAPDEFDPMISFEAEGQAAAARLPHYVTEQFGSSLGIFNPQTTDTMIVRAFAQSGTTAEWLLDQLIFLPSLIGYIGAPRNGWDTEDFRIVEGNHNASPSVALAITDGADGGDANGKFTWIPNADDGYPGDFQQKAGSGSAEYMIRVDETDHETLVNSGSGGQAGAYAYSLHGAHYREAQEFTRDDFSRSIPIALGSNKWGMTPEGYGWTSSSSKMGVDGSSGIMRAEVGPSGAFAASLGAPNNTIGAQLQLFDQWSFHGRWTLSAPVTWIIPAVTSAEVFQRLTDGNLIFSIRFDPIDKEWQFGYQSGSSFVSLSGVQDASGWYSDNFPVGWRIEMLRYTIRMRVWDATGAEPSTWDYEDFKPINTGSVESYPYSDDPLAAIQGNDDNYVDVLLNINGMGEVVDLVWDDIVIDYDPYGDPGDAGASIEQPDGGTEVGSITIPYGADYFVSWGPRTWTAADAGSYHLAFSGKVWNEVGAAELQRSNAGLYYFRSVHGGIVSMNWSSGTPSGVIRVHA